MPPVEETKRYFVAQPAASGAAIIRVPIDTICEPDKPTDK